jgi:8-oxo-dGTP pyrophosphatase MutT (NUDIX family)
VYTTSDSTKELKKQRTKSKRKKRRKTKEIDQVSAGGVIFRITPQNEINIALLRDQNTHNWILPKGRIEEGETLIDTSIREVKEETGLQNLKLVKKIGKTNYWFRTKKKPRFTKEVHFYLFQDNDQNDKLEFEEDNFDKGKWFSKKEAISAISFAAQRRILNKAYKIIDKEYQK